MWGALLSGVVDLLGSFLDIKKVKLLRTHSDEYLALEKELHELMKASYDDLDDFKIADVKAKMRIVKSAFERDMALIGGSGGASSP